jgi:ubiquinol-cytochrome c reductase cytochrome c1 subunit
MKKLLLVLLSAPLLAFASGAELHLDKAPDHSRDYAALQSGAQIFVNYCLNCHSASYMRYNRLRDIGLTEAQIRENLMFAAEKVGEPMTIAMQRADAKTWFGAPPPDLTVIARARATDFGSGADWLYTYLRSFYRDDERPTGWNNVVFANVGMPHVLWELQGVREPVFETREAHEHEVKVFTGWKQISPG